jgi:hypothetical protein
MNARSRPMPAEQFVYGDEQWMRMRAIVERAGGDVARDKFDAHRTILEKTVEGWKWKIENWDGRTWGQADGPIHRRIERAAGKLNEGLAELGLPANFPRP